MPLLLIRRIERAHVQSVHDDSHHRRSESPRRSSTFGASATPKPVARRESPTPVHYRSAFVTAPLDFANEPCADAPRALDRCATCFGSHRSRGSSAGARPTTAASRQGDLRAVRSLPRSVAPRTASLGSASNFGTAATKFLLRTFLSLPDEIGPRARAISRIERAPPSRLGPIARFPCCVVRDRATLAPGVVV